MLEVCVDCIESVIAAEQGGASRIELCSALSEGGLTPTLGTLKTLKSKLNCKIPIFCMLRPRRGNDFLYTPEEIQSLLYDIEYFKENGADGFVFGALDANRNIDVENCKTIISAIGNLPVTFHRAFDLTDPHRMHENAQLIKDLGFKRILASGFETTAEKGINALKELVSYHEDLIIMPGSGVNSKNLEKILLETNCKEFHASARAHVANSDENSESISMGGGKSDAEPRQVTCSRIVRELVDIAKRCK